MQIYVLASHHTDGRPPTSKIVQECSYDPNKCNDIKKHTFTSFGVCAKSKYFRIELGALSVDSLNGGSTDALKKAPIEEKKIGKKLNTLEGKGAK